MLSLYWYCSRSLTERFGVETRAAYTPGSPAKEASSWQAISTARVSFRIELAGWSGISLLYIGILVTPTANKDICKGKGEITWAMQNKQLAQIPTRVILANVNPCNVCSVNSHWHLWLHLQPMVDSWSNRTCTSLCKSVFRHTCRNNERSLIKHNFYNFNTSCYFWWGRGKLCGPLRENCKLWPRSLQIKWYNIIAYKGHADLKVPNGVFDSL